MFGKKSPEQPSDDFSLSHISDQDDVIASYRARSESQQKDQAEYSEESLAGLSPEEQARRRKFQDAVRGMVDEKHENDQRSGRRTYTRRFGNTLSEGSVVPRLVTLGVVGIASLFGPGIITDANYGDERAAQYLEEVGYTDVELTGESQFLVSWQGCDGTDAVKYSFEATAVNGVDTDVIVCKGMFKGATIRD